MVVFQKRIKNILLFVGFKVFVEACVETVRDVERVLVGTVLVESEPQKGGDFLAVHLLQQPAVLPHQLLDLRQEHSGRRMAGLVVLLHQRRELQLDALRLPLQVLEEPVPLIPQPLHHRSARASMHHHSLDLLLPKSSADLQ